MRRIASLWLKRFGQSAAIVAALGGGWAGYLRLTGNFHPIENSVIYRSGQLSEGQFVQRIRDNRIRTIINLRGNNTGQSWYDDEIRASAATGVQHVDCPISAGRELTDDQVTRLADIMRNAVRPLLIHCEAGADRSGLAAALYQFLVAGRSAVEASQQLSFRYGHFPWLGSRTIAMDRTFERVVSRLEANKQGD